MARFMLKNPQCCGSSPQSLCHCEANPLQAQAQETLILNNGALLQLSIFSGRVQEIRASRRSSRPLDAMAGREFSKMHLVFTSPLIQVKKVTTKESIKVTLLLFISRS